MPFLVKAQNPTDAWVIATGMTAADYIGMGDGDCDLPPGVEEKHITWFKSLDAAKQHPAVSSYHRRQESEDALKLINQLKSDQAYSAKSFDAWRYRQAYPTQEQSDAAEFDANEYKDLAVEVEELGITAWEASGAVLEAVQALRDVERMRVKEKKLIKDTMPVE